jgi:gluconokinase
MQMSKLIIVMGVSGSGKTTLAKILSNQLQWRFVEADDFHSHEAKQMMKNGIPLTDSMRTPWLEKICQHLSDGSAENTVLAYSGLKQQHRQLFRELGYQTLFVLLHGDFDLIKQRIEQRQAHFMPTSLLQSQFDALQVPSAESDCVIIDIGATDHSQVAINTAINFAAKQIQ